MEEWILKRLDEIKSRFEEIEVLMTKKEIVSNQSEMKKISKEYGLPVIEGSDDGVKDKQHAKEICKKIGFPVLIKASAGGGCKGMKIVYKESEFDDLFATAKSEAQKYFGNDELYIE